MLHELRIYESVPGRLPAMTDRFENVILKLWQRHGIQPVGFWTSVFGAATNLSLYYLLAWPSLDERERRMNAFLADPEWIAAKAASEPDGPLVARVTSTILKPTAFSALR